MIDQETESLWSQLLGEAMKGPLQGAVLEPIASTLTDWKAWKNLHPQTTVMLMRRTATDYRRSIHLRGYDLLIGLAENGKSKCWDFVLLARERIVNDRLGERKVLVVYDKASGTAAIFDRNVKGRLLSFEYRNGQLVDRETGSQWDLLMGVATTRPLQGTRLTQLPAVVSDHRAWYTFHPETEEVILPQDLPALHGKRS